MHANHLAQYLERVVKLDHATAVARATPILKALLQHLERHHHEQGGRWANEYAVQATPIATLIVDHLPRNCVDLVRAPRHYTRANTSKRARSAATLGDRNEDTLNMLPLAAMEEFLNFEVLATSPVAIQSPQEIQQLSLEGKVVWLCEMVPKLCEELAQLREELERRNEGLTPQYASM